MRTVVVLAALVLVAASRVAAAEPDLARGDAAYARRGDGQADGRGRPEPIAEAVAAYEAALAADPPSLAAHWRLIRALWFAGDFTSADAATRRAFFERGRRVSDGALALVAARLGGASVLRETGPERLREKLARDDVADVARVYFWSAIDLGAWSRVVGLWDAVRAGVADRLHDYALRVIALEPGVEEGGAFRLLSRLHAELPRVPLLTGWVDRTQALPLIERSFVAYPDHPGNRYLLGLTLLEMAPDRRAEGLALVENVARSEPRPAEIVEDTALRQTARDRLQQETRQ